MDSSPCNLLTVLPIPDHAAGERSDNDHNIFSSQWSQQNTLPHQNPASDGRSLSPIFTLLTVCLGSRSVWVTPNNYFRSELARTGAGIAQSV